ncbi:hypothetical protein [Streptomyces sp. NPDC018031]|uniref:hypothetical protein n=1 Tax=Streptomyces sp. NPDC018031 TaxID=3365033 RepID=UPI00379D6966
MPDRLRFFSEPGIRDTPLWPTGVDSPYGYPCELTRLPIGPALREEPARLCAWFQSSVDWTYPPGPSPWSGEQRERFDRQADAALASLRRELGDEWTVLDQRLPR